jgi:predicted RNA binding protein YcfA (HicA-like mRNA interferase family)
MQRSFGEFIRSKSAAQGTRIGSDLKKAGFVGRGGKGNHRNFVHPRVRKPVTISGNEGDDALHYQEKAAKLALKEVQQ